MIISTILSRENISTNSQINIVWTESDENFKSFVQSLGHNLIYFSDLYYANNIPQLIICNNKVEHYLQVYNLSNRLHLPVLVIDHEPKNKFLDSSKVTELDQFPCYHHICLSENIKQSWAANNAQIVSYDINNTESKKIWQNLIFQTAKKIFLH